jgi:hypothetical protein
VEEYLQQQQQSCITVSVLMVPVQSYNAEAQTLVVMPWAHPASLRTACTSRNRPGYLGLHGPATFISVLVVNRQHASSNMGIGI